MPLHLRLGGLSQGFALFPLLVRGLGEDNFYVFTFKVLPIEISQSLSKALRGRRGQLNGGPDWHHKRGEELSVRKNYSPYLYSTVPLLKVNEGIVFQFLHPLQLAKLTKGVFQYLLSHCTC